MFVIGPKRSILQAMLAQMGEGDQLSSDVISGMPNPTTGEHDVKTDAGNDDIVCESNSPREDHSSLSGLGPGLNLFLNTGAPGSNNQVDSNENGRFSCNEYKA